MRRPCFLVGLLVVLGVQASLAVAAPPIGLSAFGGYQAFAMGDINDRIHEVDDALSSPGDLANLHELRGNWTWGGGVKVDLVPTWRAYLEYEFLRDDTGFGNTNGQFQLKPSASSVLLGGTYFFPSAKKVR
jgi:opacity protein-like surface antigen